MSRFSGKTVIITGSSNGIGRSAALIFAKDGAQVTITGRHAERLEETRQQLLKAGVPAGNINSVVADVTESSGQDQIINSTLAKFGKIDILVRVYSSGFLEYVFKSLGQQRRCKLGRWHFQHRSTCIVVRKNVQGELSSCHRVDTEDQGALDQDKGRDCECFQYCSRATSGE